MYGICGIKGLIFEERNRYVDDMLNVLCQQGLDRESKYSNEDVSLGIRGPNSEGLNTDSQPIYNENKNVIVMCIGRICNLPILKGDLIKKRHDFVSNSDAETIIHLYEEHGVECLKYIKGMFSFALWDKNEKKLLIVRDRFGSKPLYYYEKNGIFAFSSELKGLFKLPFINKELDIQAVNLYFSLEYVPSPYSIFKNVYKLKPAHYISYKNDSIEINKYWNLDAIDTNSNISFDEAKDRLMQLLRSSIKERIASGVSSGIFLSGGIDSSTLVALSKEFCSQNLTTFSIGFEEKSFDESKYAFTVSKYFGTKHYNYIFTVDDFINNFYDVANFFNEPFADLSIFPTYMLSNFSRQHVSSVLSGEGGDELLMGYPTYIAHQYVNLFNKFPDFLKKISKRLIDQLPVSHRYFSFDFKIKQFVKGTDIRDPVLRHFLWTGAFSDSERKMLFNKKQDGCDLMNYGIINQLSKNLKDLNSHSENRIIQCLDILNLCDNVLVKSDRAGMFSSLEIRMPYLDHQLAEFVLSLKPEFIYQKRLLKKAMSGILPKKILTRPKKGFPIPFSAWLNNSKVLKMVECLFDKNFLKKQGLFNCSYPNSLLKEHISGKSDNRKKLRTYIMFQSWYRNWFS